MAAGDQNKDGGERGGQSPRLAEGYQRGENKVVREKIEMHVGIET